MLIVRAGSVDPKPALSYPVISSVCRVTSHHTLRICSVLIYFHSSCVYTPLLHGISFSLSLHLLTSHGSWLAFYCWKSLPVKKEFVIPTLAK